MSIAIYKKIVHIQTKKYEKILKMFLKNLKIYDILSHMVMKTL